MHISGSHLFELMLMLAAPAWGVFSKPFFEQLRSDPLGTAGKVSTPLAKYLFLPASLFSSIWDLYSLSRIALIDAHFVIRVAFDLSICTYVMVMYFVFSLAEDLKAAVVVLTRSVSLQGSMLEAQGEVIKQQGALSEIVHSVVEANQGVVQSLSRITDAINKNDKPSIDHA